MVLIKDMALPFCCERCRLKDSKYNECRVKWKRLSPYGDDFATGRPSWCPLTEVEPYGPDGVLYKEK